MSGGARAAGGTAGALPAAPLPPSPSRQPARASPAAGPPAGGAPLVHSRRMRRSAASLPGPTVTSCAPSMSSTACDGEQAGQGRAAGLSGLQHRAGGTRSTRSTHARARLVPLPLPRAPARARRARRCAASWPVLSARSQRPRGPQQRVAGRWRAARSGAGASPAPARARGLARSGCLRRREQVGGGEERRVCSAPLTRQPLRRAGVGASQATGGTSRTRGQRFGQSATSSAEPQAFWLAAAAPTQVPEDLGALQPLERRGHAALQLQGACEHPGGSWRGGRRRRPRLRRRRRGERRRRRCCIPGRPSCPLAHDTHLGPNMSAVRCIAPRACRGGRGTDPKRALAGGRACGSD